MHTWSKLTRCVCFLNSDHLKTRMKIYLRSLMFLMMSLQITRRRSFSFKVEGDTDLDRG